MTLTDVPEVVVDPSGGYKFIVAKLTDSNGKEKLVVRAMEEHCDYHDDILNWLKREVSSSGLKTFCIGGGRIEVSPDEKIIRIWGESGAFGKEPNREETVRMLQAAFPEFQVTAS